MYSNPVDLSFSYLRSAVEASLVIKKVHMKPNTDKQIQGPDPALSRHFSTRSRSSDPKLHFANHWLGKNFRFCYWRNFFIKVFPVLKSLKRYGFHQYFLLICMYFVTVLLKYELNFTHEVETAIINKS